MEFLTALELYLLILFMKINIFYIYSKYIFNKLLFCPNVLEEIH